VHREQVRNREAARTRLAALVQAALTPPAIRKATRVRAGEREKRLVAKKRRSDLKRTRGRGDAD
jgi:ribosome-associated protein